MMNPEFDKIMRADGKEQLGIYTATAIHLGTTPQNIEKDFWVCWTLDALFNGLVERPRLLFKGGTSLSKGFDLIKRFSEDIDITVFREDIDRDKSVEELQKTTTTQRKKYLKAIRKACEEYIQNACLEQFSTIINAIAERNGLSTENFYIEPDSNNNQTLLLHYPTATPTASENYIQKIVKIEAGAQSALDPNSTHIIRPYLEGNMSNTNLSVGNITTIDAERTLWDKILILHRFRSSFYKDDKLKGDAHRVSRHYYDIFQLLNLGIAQKALENRKLGNECVEHSQMFFDDRADYNLANASFPTLSIRPEGEMIDVLRRDYDAMSGMIFGDAPAFKDIMEGITELEAILTQED